MPIPLLAVAAAGFITSGGLDGIVGGGKRRTEQRNAKTENRQRLNDVENFQFNTGQYTDLKNPFSNLTDTSKGLTNRYRNLRVGTEAAEFQRQGQSQDLANIADAIRQGGGSANSATALARQAAQSNQQIAAGLQQQQIGNQLRSAQGQTQIDQIQQQAAARRQELFGQGEQYITGLKEQREYNRQDKLSFLLGRSDTRLNAANAARQKATQAFSKGLGGAVGAVGAGFAGGGSFDGTAGLNAATGYNNQQSQIDVLKSILKG